MGEFNGKIVAEFTPPKTWELEKSLSFKPDDLSEAEIELLKDIGVNISSTGIITCEKGMKTDLASVPGLYGILFHLGTLLELQLFMTIYMQL